jgi:hypothetical protein
MTGFDAGEADDEVADQPPSPNTKTGEFFVIDRRTFMAACALGLNPAIAYLVIARGAGSRRTSPWSVDAIERYTGISRPKAKIAVATLIENGFITLERSGTRPLYGIVPPHERQANNFSADDRIVLELIGMQKWVRIPSAHIGTAVDLARRGFLLKAVGHLKFSRNCDAFFSEEPRSVWLPNAVVDGAADERPPLALLRQMQDVRCLNLFIALYDVNNLPNDGGVSRAILYQEYTLKKVSQRGPLTIWGFNSGCTTFSASATPLHNIFLTGQKNDKGADTGMADFWSALDGLSSCGLINFIPHVFESNKPEAEMIHAYATESYTGETWEHSVAEAAHAAAWISLESEFREWAAENDYHLLPVPSHISNVAVIGIARLRYRPKTRMTAAWFAMSKGRSEAWQATYESTVQSQTTFKETG